MQDSPAVSGAGVDIRPGRLPSPPSGVSSALRAYVRLCRPPDSSLAFFGTFIGAGLAGVEIAHLPVAVLLAWSNALLSGASMMINDWHDVDEDRINAPGRPIPSGAVPRDRVFLVGIGLFLLGFVAAYWAAPVFGLASLGVIAVSVAYTLRLKPMPMVGHASTAVLSAYPLWCWMLAEGFGGREYLAAAAGFVIAGVGREVTRTVADAPGDRVRGIRTVATLYGGAAANSLGCALVGLGLLIALVPAAADPLRAYPVALAGGITAVLHHVAVPLRALPARDTSRRLTRLTRVLTGLLAAAIACDFVFSGARAH